MQLILETEPTLAIRDMSSVENIASEKAGNGDITQIKINSNGNKENIADVNVIMNVEEVPKQITGGEENVKRDLQLKDKEVDDVCNNVATTKEDDCLGELNTTSDTKAQIEESHNTNYNADTNESKENVNRISEAEKVINPVRTECETTEIDKTSLDNEDVSEESQSNKVKDDENIAAETKNNLQETDLTETENKPKEIVENPTEIDNNPTAMENISKETENNATETTNNSTETKSVPTEIENNSTETDCNVTVERVSNEKHESKMKETDDICTVTDNISVENKSDSVETKNNIEETDNNRMEIDITPKETEEKLVETEQDDYMEDEEDIISIKDDVLDQARDTVDTASDVTIVENIVAKDKTIIEESLNTKDDVEVIEELTETEVSCKTTADVSKACGDNNKSSESNKDTQSNISNDESKKPNCDSSEIKQNSEAQDSPIELKDDMDVEEIVDEVTGNKNEPEPETKVTAPVNTIIDKPSICKLSNTLDILSDDEEPTKEEPAKVDDSNQKQCINIEDDDDIMLIDEDTSKTEAPKPADKTDKEEVTADGNTKADMETGDKTKELDDSFSNNEKKEGPTPSEEDKNRSSPSNLSDKKEQTEIKSSGLEPLLPENFLKSAKKNISEMTREDLEEFCILKIVESIVDRSNLSDIKNKLKSMAQGIDEYRKKAMMLTKQNRDLQVVLKSIQEEQKKMAPGVPITPLKITRSVGMQVYMEKPGVRRKSLAQINNTAANSPNNKPNVRSPVPAQVPRLKVPSTQAIPVPRLVPANAPALKSPQNVIPQANPVNANKSASPMPNGIRNPSPQKVAEKRPHNKVSSSVTVDLTDDEPPSKMNNNRTSPAPPVRLVSPQNLMATPRQSFTPSNNSRKVYIPISGPQSQNIRAGQTIMLKTVPGPGMRPRGPNPQVARLSQTGAVRMNRIQSGRHPAPLPDAAKQYQPPNWKALPPAPELKLSKVENGIVISWKIEGCLADSYEEIASYQLYAYQETSSPPSTSLWKKIGDVKALPLPMACTLTQFMAGFKYYFAVRAVDIRSRIGPFSLPGSILLLNKM